MRPASEATRSEGLPSSLAVQEERGAREGFPGGFTRRPRDPVCAQPASERPTSLAHSPPDSRRQHTATLALLPSLSHTRSSHSLAYLAPLTPRDRQLSLSGKTIPGNRRSSLLHCARYTLPAREKHESRRSCCCFIVFVACLASRVAGASEGRPSPSRSRSLGSSGTRAAAAAADRCCPAADQRGL